MANEDPPSFWRLRETRRLVDWLRERPASGINAAEILSWLSQQPNGPWWSLLEAGIEEFSRELGERETAPHDVIEWLAEWGREARKRQTGLLLLTAHRAKGLEFDDVVVLDGGWDRASRGEDRDAARRLYYVAMTRARRSLAMVSRSAKHAIARDLVAPCFLMREIDESSIDTSDCRRVYQQLDLSQVDLSYAGRLRDGHPALDAIARLEAGDPVSLRRNGDRWDVVNGSGVTVGRLAQRYRAPTDACFLSGKVLAVISRRREDSVEEYQSVLKRATWEVVVPELVHEI